MRVPQGMEGREDDTQRMAWIDDRPGDGRFGDCHDGSSAGAVAGGKWPGPPRPCPAAGGHSGFLAPLAPVRVTRLCPGAGRPSRFVLRIGVDLEATDPDEPA